MRFCQILIIKKPKIAQRTHMEGFLDIKQGGAPILAILRGGSQIIPILEGVPRFRW